MNLKFKRQVPIEQYIVDFCCNEKKLIIELDDSHHKTIDNTKADRVRDEALKNLGYKVLRFNNNDLDINREGILEIIRVAVNHGSTSP